MRAARRRRQPDPNLKNLNDQAALSKALRQVLDNLRHVRAVGAGAGAEDGGAGAAEGAPLPGAAGALQRRQAAAAAAKERRADASGGGGDERSADQGGGGGGGGGGGEDAGLERGGGESDMEVDR